MSGKIFPDSANMWQDQAKILFNYYRRAAERIVTEEERIEKCMADLEEQKVQLEQKKSTLWYWFLTIVLFFMYFIKKKEIDKEIEDLDTRIIEFRTQHRKIFRDYRVTRLGIAYVPVAEQIAYDDKNFMIDFTGAVPEQKFSMSVSRHSKLLVDTLHTLDALTKEAPLVETSENSETVATDDYSLSIQEIRENDYLGALERNLRTVAYCMDDLDTTSVSLPLATTSSQYLKQLDEFASDGIPSGAPEIKVFDSDAYTPAIDKFREINRLKNSLSDSTLQFEEVLRHLMNTIATSVQTLSQLKVASVDKVVLESNKLLYRILKAPYNHYSPALEAEEIDRIRHERFDYSDSAHGYEPFRLKPSSRVRFNPASGVWVAEDGSQTAVPFGVHQLYEEIVAPMVQNLMGENRLERLKIYNHIRDQKLSYLNKWHQDTDAFYRANRAESADIINLMQESLREYVAAYNTLVALKNTEESMTEADSLDSTVVSSVENSGETLAAFQMQSQEFQRVQNDFEDYIERLKDDIDLKAERFGHVEYYDAKLRDGYSHDVAEASAEVSAMEPRRKTLATVNPKLAKDAELPPEPNVSDITFEHFSINLPSLAKEAISDIDSLQSWPGDEPAEDDTCDSADHDCASDNRDTTPTGTPENESAAPDATISSDADEIADSDSTDGDTDSSPVVFPDIPPVPPIS